MKRIIVILFSFLCLFSSVQAKIWNSQTRKAYRKTTSYAMLIDFSQAKFSGLDSAEFVTYYSNKEKKDPAFINLVLKKFKLALAESTEKTLRKKIMLDDTSSSNFVFSFKIKEVTEDAGIKGELYVYPKDRLNDALIFDFKQKDGRWNDFDILLVENATKIGKRMEEIDRLEDPMFGRAMFFLKKLIKE